VTAPAFRSFALPDELAAKAAAGSWRRTAHFADIAAALADATDDETTRIDTLLAAPARIGREALERDEEVRRRSGRLRLLSQLGLDLCLGRMTADGATPPTSAGSGSPTAPDVGCCSTGGRRPQHRSSQRRAPSRSGWSPAAATAGRAARSSTTGTSCSWTTSTPATSLLTRSRRSSPTSAPLAATASAMCWPPWRPTRTPSSAPAEGALVVEGGPGTGKTVVALHRTAYLLYSDARVGAGRGGVLVVGPSRPYLSYVADVLPGLGEEGVRMATLRDLVPEGVDARDEADPVVRALKSSARTASVVEAAVRFYEEPPSQALEVSTSVVDVVVTPDDWAAAFDAAEPGTAYNEARDQVWDALVELLAAKAGDDAVRPPPPRARRRRRPGRRVQPRVAAARRGGCRGRPVAGTRVPAAVRALAGPRRGRHAAARGAATA
jgi:hypothetical protein